MNHMTYPYIPNVPNQYSPMPPNQYTPMSSNQGIEEEIKKIKVEIRQLKEKITEFAEATLTMGVDNDDDSIFSPLLGEKTETYKINSGTEGESKDVTVYKSNSDDIPVYFGFGQVVPKMLNGTRMYKVEWFPKVQFKPYHNDAKTKGDSLEFTTPSIEGTIFVNKEKDWRKRATFDNEKDANDFLDSLFVQSA